MTAYSAPMLPNVDYQELQSQRFFSLADLEVGVLDSYTEFLDVLKSALLKENLAQAHELIIAHLAAFLGATLSLHTVLDAEALEPHILELIKHQANTACRHFNYYPLNRMAKSREEKLKNLHQGQAFAPGSIVTQTMRLERLISETLKELADNRKMHLSRYQRPKQEQLFCPDDTLIKILFLVGGKKCGEWRKQLSGLSDHYVLNHMAIQLGWLIGYFSHLDHKSPVESQYLEYALPLVSMYREQTFKLMESYAHAQHIQKYPQEKETSEALVKEIRTLSEKTHSQVPPAITEYQKQVAIVQAGVEKAVVELLTQGCSPKIILMSLFFFWFSLEAPLQTKNPKTANLDDPFSHMTAVINIAKKAIISKPAPKLSPELQALNVKMQQLKRDYFPDPERLDQELPENIAEQTEQVNVTLHILTSDYMKQNYPLEAVAIVLFSQWLHMSVFFGVSEQDWQKMDYYFKEILEETRAYLRKNIT